ncbi:MAG: TetR/AcrR family transcriptional regulator, partial [Clostridia bacterium]|nr:TetR/AcrR family transcriptional regulator [Clostridia bacterium]
MPRQIRISKEDIINTTVDIVRRSGDQAINARTIAAALNCSTQPIFSNFDTMDQLRLAVVERADKMCQEYMDREMKRGEYPIY